MKNLGGNTILITGGSNGIGLALAKRFVDLGNEVIICGRDPDKLSRAKKAIPKLHTYPCDVGKELERVALVQWIVKNHLKTNILVNNAGIQRRFDIAEGSDSSNSWTTVRSEIDINYSAPIHLTQLMLPQLKKQKNAAIMNVTSGLAFVPIAAMPVYCSTKAALHSFTLSLREQLKSANIEVIEIIPPAVDTDLGGPGLHKFGVPIDEFANAVFAQLKEGKAEIAYGFAQEASKASPQEQEKIFARMNSRRE